MIDTVIIVIFVTMIVMITIIDYDKYYDNIPTFKAR